MTLPSRRTLRDYTHYFKSKPGFQVEVDSFLREESHVDEIEDWKRYEVETYKLTLTNYKCRNVCVAFDEMKIHQDLVFDKSGEIIGFVDTGDVNNKIRSLENFCNGESHDTIASHMLTLMVRGIFIRLDFPYAQFPTSGTYTSNQYYDSNAAMLLILLDLSGVDLHSILWEATRRLEQIGLHVVAYVCDGAKPNRKFFRDHKYKPHMKDGIVYKTPNLYRPGEFIYFFSDVPHLMKTTRNAWANSKENGSRDLTVLLVHMV